MKKKSDYKTCVSFDLTSYLFSPRVEEENEASVRYYLELPSSKKDDPADPALCPLLRETIIKCTNDLKEALNASGDAFYKGGTKGAELTGVEIKASHMTSELLLIFKAKSNVNVALRRLIQDLRKNNNNVYSVFIKTRDESSAKKTVLKHFAGSRFLRETICDLGFEIGPDVSFENNLFQSETTVRRLEALIGHPDKNDVAWDLSCGVGVTSLVLAKAGFRVLAVEQDEELAAAAKHNFKLNKPIREPHLITDSLERARKQFPPWSVPPSVIVIDDNNVLTKSTRNLIATSLSAVESPVLFFYSTEPETLSKNVSELKEYGLNLKQLETYDKLPFENQMLWLAVMTK